MCDIVVWHTHVNANLTGTTAMCWGVLRDTTSDEFNVPVPPLRIQGLADPWSIDVRGN